MILSRRLPELQRHRCAELQSWHTVTSCFFSTEALALLHSSPIAVTTVQSKQQGLRCFLLALNTLAPYLKTAGKLLQGRLHGVVQLRSLTNESDIAARCPQVPALTCNRPHRPTLLLALLLQLCSNERTAGASSGQRGPTGPFAALWPGACGPCGLVGGFDLVAPLPAACKWVVCSQIFAAAQATSGLCSCSLQGKVFPR